MCLSYFFFYSIWKYSLTFSHSLTKVPYQFSLEVNWKGHNVKRHVSPTLGLHLHRIKKNSRNGLMAWKTYCLNYAVHHSWQQVWIEHLHLFLFILRYFIEKRHLKTKQQKQRRLTCLEAGAIYRRNQLCDGKNRQAKTSWITMEQRQREPCTVCTAEEGKNNKKRKKTQMLRAANL